MQALSASLCSSAKHRRTPGRPTWTLQGRRTEQGILPRAPLASVARHHLLHTSLGTAPAASSPHSSPFICGSAFCNFSCTHSAEVQKRVLLLLTERQKVKSRLVLRHDLRHSPLPLLVWLLSSPSITGKGESTTIRHFEKDTTFTDQLLQRVVIIVLFIMGYC